MVQGRDGALLVEVFVVEVFVGIEVLLVEVVLLVGVFLVGVLLLGAFTVLGHYVRELGLLSLPEAVAQGADYVVVGRPILAAPDPRAAVAALEAAVGAAPATERTHA